MTISVVVDLLIAASMCWYLFRKKTGFARQAHPIRIYAMMPSPVSRENYNAMWYIARIVTILVAGDLCVSITIDHNNVRTASIHRIHGVVLML